MGDKLNVRMDVLDVLYEERWQNKEKKNLVGEWKNNCTMEVGCFAKFVTNLDNEIHRNPNDMYVHVCIYDSWVRGEEIEIKRKWDVSLTKLTNFLIQCLSIYLQLANLKA